MAPYKKPDTVRGQLLTVRGHTVRGQWKAVRGQQNAVPLSLIGIIIITEQMMFLAFM